MEVLIISCLFYTVKYLINAFVNTNKTQINVYSLQIKKLKKLIKLIKTHESLVESFNVNIQNKITRNFFLANSAFNKILISSSGTHS